MTEEAICKWLPGDDWQWKGEWMEEQPLIRCKDCKHYNNLLYTLCPQSGMNVIDDEEDYCSWAERKEE